MKRIRFSPTLFLLVIVCCGLQFTLSAQWIQVAPNILTPTAFNGNSGAKVGIGTDAPTARLTVLGTVGPLLDLKSNNTSWSTLQFSNTNNGKWNIKGLVAASNTDDRLAFYNDAAGTIMSLTGDGKVGIGTDDPGSTLTVANSSGSTLGLHNNSSGWSGLKFTNEHSGSWWINAKLGNTGAEDEMAIYNDAAGTIMTLTGEGKVGIGTNEPGSTLTVANSSGSTLGLHANSTEWSGLKFTNENSGSWWINAKVGDTGTDDEMAIYNDAAGTILTLTGDGNVGIGTGSPNNKLDVNGTIRSKEIRVETGWADYVFTDDFRLRPLAEVERFIRENKHLPDVTPASEIQAEGLQVAKVMTEMMQKIEELTLYVIQLKKDNDALEAQLSELKQGRK